MDSKAGGKINPSLLNNFQCCGVCSIQSASFSHLRVADSKSTPELSQSLVWRKKWPTLFIHPRPCLKCEAPVSERKRDRDLAPSFSKKHTHTHAQKLPSDDGTSRCLSVTCQRSCDSPTWKCSKLFHKKTPPGFDKLLLYGLEQPSKGSWPQCSGRPGVGLWVDVLLCLCVFAQLYPRWQNLWKC